MDGIVLKAIPYEEDGKILKIFTKDVGLLSVIAKKLRRKETFWQTVTSPLARGEFHLKRRQSDLYSLSEVSLTDSYLPIRSDLERLDAACALLRSLLASQYPEKSSSNLYLLTITYLNKLKTFTPPYLLALSFQMKLLNYEGLFPETKEELTMPLSSDEWLILECLCHAKQFDLLQQLEVSPSLREKVNKLFSDRITDYN